jgi:hypothetical protein
MIDDESLAQLTLTLELPEADAEELDALTRQLRDEILEAPVESVEFVPDAAAPEGTKGIMALAPGALAVTLRPGVLSDFLDNLRYWLGRHEDRRVEITLNIGGNPVHIKATADDLAQVMQALSNSSMINRSGGADLQADQINVGGDVVGRDKIIQIHAQAGATVLVGATDAALLQPDRPDPPSPPFDAGATP